jgi:ABC-2 type transport system permease protein
MSALEDPRSPEAHRVIGSVCPRDIRSPNWLGLWALYRRQMSAFLKLGVETIGAPVVSSLLFLAVFVLALAGREEMLPGVGVAQFVAPGIAAFALAHNAFEMAAFPVLHDKLEGMIQDLVMAPLSAAELVAGYLLSAVSAALISLGVILAAVSIFVPLPMAAVGLALGFALLLAMLFGLLGLLVGLWADKWEHYSAAETFLILPLGLLSGSFFSIQVLPATGQALLRANPVFYGIDGFRAGILGHAESQIWLGAAILIAIEVVLGVLVWHLFARGYKIRH